MRSGTEPIKRLALNEPTYAAIWNAIGGGIERDEIASEAYLPLLEGKASTVAEAVTLGRKRHYRMFSLFGPNLSMDMPRFSEGNQTLHDIIAAPVPDDQPDRDSEYEMDADFGGLGEIMIAAYRRGEAVRQAA